MNPTLRMRFAPSPTGHLHIGSVRTALFNWLLARHSHGTFILRIEDTDQERSQLHFLESLLSDLRWLGLTWDEGPQVEGAHAPYFQSQRLSIYKKYCDELLKRELAYPCYCSPTELAQKRERAQKEKRAPKYDETCRNLPQNKVPQGIKPVIRFKAPHEGTLQVKDLIRGLVEFSNDSWEDFVIMKSDGFPLYNFACAVDDHEMEITHVLRGEEHLSNTPRQLLIYNAFEWSPPLFGHLSIILDEQRKKLSKREGATYLSEFREAGFLSEALLNFVALLGWAPKEDLEILPLSEIIRRFDVSGLIKSPAVFDFKKLEWMNGQYIKNLSQSDLLKALIPFLEREHISIDDEKSGWLSHLAMLFQERIKTLKQFVSESDYFLKDDIRFDPEVASDLFSTSALQALEKFIPLLSQSHFTPEALESVLRQFSDNEGIKAGDLIHPMRLFLTGKRVSPGIFQVMTLLGKEKTLTRLSEGVSKLKKST